MKFTLILIAILQLGIFGCATTQQNLPSVQVPPIATPAASPVLVTPVSNSGVVTEDLITFVCESCNAKEKIVVPKMQKELNRMIQSQCFADRFELVKYRSRLEQTDGLTRAQVVKKIQTYGVKNIPLVFYYPTWRQSKSVVGYTYPDQPEIYLNRLFRDDSDWSLCAEVSNAIHEVTHKQGFDHDFNRTERRPFSVPYTANYASDQCCIEQ